MRGFLLVAVAAGGLAVLPARAPAAGQRVSVALDAPPSGTVVPYYGASPVFRWRLAFANPGQRGLIWLEVSSTRSFQQVALETFECGYTPEPCVTSYRWRNAQPYWYDLGDRCADLPAAGGCSRRTNVFYWRVRFEPEGTSRKISSAIGMIRRATSTDAKAPVAKAEAGTGHYGRPDRFFYYASDNSGVYRAEFQLYDGDTVVYGARLDWDRARIKNERYVDLILPEAVKGGSYRWCLAVYDYSGNHSASCAAYTLTG